MNSFMFEKRERMKHFFFGFREREERGGVKRREKSLIAFRKFTENRTKFTALHLHSMLMARVDHSATIYHFLIHKNPLEILAEKTFHNFTLRISLTPFDADVTLRFFSSLSHCALSLSVCVSLCACVVVRATKRHRVVPTSRHTDNDASSESNVMF